MATTLAQAIHACVGEDLAFLTVDFTFHGQCHICQVRRQPPCRDSFEFACVGNPRIATRKVATVEVARARCPSFSSKLCSQFGPFQHGSSQERRLCKNRSHQLAGSKMVLSRDLARIISLGQLVSSCHRLQHQQLLLDTSRVCAAKK